MREMASPQLKGGGRWMRPAVQYLYTYVWPFVIRYADGGVAARSQLRSDASLEGTCPSETPSARRLEQEEWSTPCQAVRSAVDGLDGATDDNPTSGFASSRLDMLLEGGIAGASSSLSESDIPPFLLLLSMTLPL